MKRIEVSAGDRYGRLMIVQELPSKNGRRYFECICDCGRSLNVLWDSLRNQRTKSCGCFMIDNVKKQRVTHGQSSNRVYRIWAGMITRCTNKNRDDYKYYGGRGITVFSEWMSFEAFYKWSQLSGYANNLTIDRFKNELGYSPENCRWVPFIDQCKNRRSNRLITYNNKTMCLGDWAKEIGVSRNVLSSRLEKYSIENALTL